VISVERTKAEEGDAGSTKGTGAKRKIHKEADGKDDKSKTKALELEWRLRAPSTIEALKAKHMKELKEYKQKRKHCGELWGCKDGGR
jgi:hypothetical protein